jgi:hypothetical protein
LIVHDASLVLGPVLVTRTIDRTRRIGAGPVLVNVDARCVHSLVSYSAHTFFQSDGRRSRSRSGGCGLLVNRRVWMHTVFCFSALLDATGVLSSEDIQADESREKCDGSGNAACRRQKKDDSKQ